MSKSTSTSVPLTVSPEAAAFIRRQEAEEAFRTICELARECHPDLLHLEAELRDDPDEAGLQKVVVFGTLPKGYPIEQVLQQSRRFREHEVERVPLPLLLHFSLLTTYAGDRVRNYLRSIGHLPGP